MLRTRFVLLALLIMSCGAPSGGAGPSQEIMPLAEAPRATQVRTDLTATQDPFAGVEAEAVSREGDAIIMTNLRLPGPRGTIRAETLRAEGLAGPSAVWRADRVTLRGVEVEGPRGALRVGTLSVTNVTVDAACGAEGSLSSLLTCARWDEMIATFASGEGAASDDVRWRVGLATLSGFARGTVAKTRLQDVSLRRLAPAAAPTLPRLAMRLSGAPFGLGGVAEADALRVEAIDLEGAQLGTLLEGRPSVAVSAVTLGALTTSRGGAFLSGAARLDLRDLEVAEGALVRGTLTVENARSDLAAGLGPAAREAAREAGAQRLGGNARVAYAREVGGARLDARWSLRGAGSGQLGLDLTDADTEEGASGSARIGVSGGRLFVDDAGALDTAFAIAAAAEGQEARLLRRQVVGALTFVAMREAEGDPGLGRIAGALLTFAAEGGGVEVVLRPDEPVPPTVLAQAPPGEAARRLGLTVSVTD